MEAQKIQHHKYLRIQNFKRFEDLEVKDMGLFNLVVGDNNVGKTSFLEACLFHASINEVEDSLGTIKVYHKNNESLEYLLKALSFRNIANAVDEFFKYYSRVEGENVKCFAFSQDINVEIQFLFSSRDTHINESNNLDGKKSTRDYTFRKPKDIDPYSRKGYEYLKVDSEIAHFLVPFIPFQRSYGKEIADIYINKIQGDKKRKKTFVNNLKRLFPEIEDVEPLLQGNEKSLLINRSTSDYSLPLSFFGEGTIKIAKILSYFLQFQNRRLMIDEIDTGIYFDRMKGFWKVILESALENNTQLFATTHNEECIKMYLEALQELGEEYQEKARVISLGENLKTKEVSSVTYTFEEFEHSLLAENEIR